MKACGRVRQQLSAHADGELSAEDARAVEEHLAQCAGCAWEQQRLRQLTFLTALVPEEETPPGLHARILARLAAASLPARNANAPLPPAALAAAAGTRRDPSCQRRP
jgi:anti-sigma factor RsiW